MLSLVALERKPVLGSKTLTNAYIDHINEMGNIARQATIAKAALTVVHDQAITTHDQVSGVSLDQEAADLIRFQQAYQASAKILQVAGQLFDSILQVR
jgi:flagellar hook-associated protein FlgK